MANDPADDAGESGVQTTAVGGHDVTAVDGEAEGDILGYAVISTVGSEFVVQRNWLVERADELGVPEWALPSGTTNKRAWTRAVQSLLDQPVGLAASNDDVEMNLNKHDHSHYDVEVIDRRDERESRIETVLTLRYDRGHDPEVRTDLMEYRTLAGEYLSQFDTLYEMHQRSNNAEDLTKMVRTFARAQPTGGWKMRSAGAVYFVPRSSSDELAAIQELLAEIDETWKDEGYRAGLDVLEVQDTTQKREMVEAKVRSELDTIVGGVLDSATDHLNEQDAVDSIVSAVGDDLVRADAVATNANNLLDLRISIRDALVEMGDDLTDAEEEILDDVVDRVTD